MPSCRKSQDTPKVRSTTHRRGVQLLLPNAPDVLLEAATVPVDCIQAQVLGASGRATTMLSRVGLKSVSCLQPPPRSGVRPPRRPGCSSCSHLLGRVASNGAPPKRALPMEQSADCHSQSTPFFAALHQNSPDALQAPSVGPVDSAVVSQDGSTGSHCASGR